MAEFDESAVRLDLEETWKRLAGILAEAKSIEVRTQAEPRWLENEWVDAHTRFTFIFDKELRDAQTVYDGVASGVRVPMDKLLAAWEAERRLLSIISQAREEAQAHGARAEFESAAPEPAAVTMASAG